MVKKKDMGYGVMKKEITMRDNLKMIWCKEKGYSILRMEKLNIKEI